MFSLLNSPEEVPLPTMKIIPEVKNIFAFKFKYLTLGGYDLHPAIKASVAI